MIFLEAFHLSVWQNFLRNDLVLKMSITSVNILTHHSWFLLHLSLFHEKKGQFITSSLFISGLAWMSVGFCSWFIAQHNIMDYLQEICWILVMFILGVSESVLARRLYSAAFWGGVTHYNVQNFDSCVVDWYICLSSLTWIVPSSCSIAIPEETDFGDKTRWRRTFTAPFSFCWILFFHCGKEKAFSKYGKWHIL